MERKSPCLHRILPRAGVLILLALVTASAAMATTLVRMDLDKLTRTAAVVARARCVGTSSQWADGHLWTLSKFEVVELWKNTAPQTIVVRLVGGDDGRRKVMVDGVPRFRAGEEVVLFLEPSGRGELTVTSWAQGTFRIRRAPGTQEESVTQDTSGVSVLDAVTGKFRTGGVRPMQMAEFRARVLRAVAAAAGSASAVNRR